MCYLVWLLKAVENWWRKYFFEDNIKKWMILRVNWIFLLMKLNLSNEILRDDWNTFKNNKLH